MLWSFILRISPENTPGDDRDKFPLVISYNKMPVEKG
jgi:hypothetical protein